MWTYLFRKYSHMRSCFAAKYLIACLILASCLCSCQNRLRDALGQAGENRGELEKVLRHFRGDGQKEDAAKFLIANMPLHKSYCGEIEAYYSAIDSAMESVGDKDSFKQVMDSTYHHYRHSLDSDFDVRTINSEYLISNIEAAFKVWRTGKWASHLDFEEFCEYVLPYKCIENQPFDDWRNRLAPVYRGNADVMERECKEYNRNAKVAALEVNRAMVGNYLKYTKQLQSYPIYRPETLIGLPYGTCIESCIAALEIQRSKGIPVSIDFIPQWPNRKYGHYWLTVLDNNHKSIPFAPFDIESDVLQNRTLSKVFRMTYSPNEELIKRIYGGYKIPNSLGYLFFQDVTDEYVRTQDIVVELFKGVKASKNIYVATFNNQEWVPVDWGMLEVRHKARFHKLGRNVLYMPVEYGMKGECRPIGRPFYVGWSGDVQYFESISDKTETVELYRKYPVYEFVYKNSEKIRGGEIQVASGRGLSEALTILTLPADSLTLAGHVRMESPVRGRYFKFIATGMSRCDMAELIFYDVDGKRLAPSLIKCGREVHPDNKVNLASAINDDDPLTFFSAWGEDDIWVGFDFGGEVELAEIDYFRRSDGNNLYPGYEYMLSYWDGKAWTELKRMTADKTLCFSSENVPKGALLLLTCLTTGTESRPFVYDCGKITWY